MEEMKFETDSLSQGGASKFGADKTPAMVRLLLKLGVPDARMANLILFSIAVLGFIGTFFLYARLFTGTTE